MLVENEIQCPECKCSNNITDYFRAEIICKNCGLVLNDNCIQHNSEWWILNNIDYKQKDRIGAPLKLTTHNNGLSTIIGRENRDANGNMIPNKNRYKYYKLRKLDYKIKISSNKEKYLVNALRNLNRMSSSLELPINVRETAAYIYIKAVKMSLLKGRSVEYLSAAALYYSCKICNVPRTLHEINKISNVDEKKIGKYYKFLTKSIKFKINPTTAYNYLSRFCNELNLSYNVFLRSLEILKKAESKELTIGRNPVIIAAASIYLASVSCDSHRTQKEVANVAGITDLGLRKVYKKLLDC
jgi:transcription initiation factor TFIIB